MLKYLNKDEETVDEIKVEFKYGVTTLTEYPEIYSKYTKGASIFHNKDYIKYNHVNRFLDDYGPSFDNWDEEKISERATKLAEDAYTKIWKFDPPFLDLK